MLKNACEHRCESYECVANETWVTNMHNTHCGCFSLSYICQPLSNQLYIFLQICTHCPFCPAFYGNVNTNARESLQTSYDHYKCLTNNKNGLRLVTNMLQMVTNML